MGFGWKLKLENKFVGKRLKEQTFNLGNDSYRLSINCDICSRKCASYPCKNHICAKKKSLKKFLPSSAQQPQKRNFDRKKHHQRPWSGRKSISCPQREHSE